VEIQWLLVMVTLYYVVLTLKSNPVFVSMET
jgi:hypothetical protein